MGLGGGARFERRCRGWRGLGDRLPMACPAGLRHGLKSRRCCRSLGGARRRYCWGRRGLMGRALAGGRWTSWKSLLAAQPKKTDGRYTWIGRDTTLPTMFHPHIYECRKRGQLSPLELFNSDEDLKGALRKALCLHGRISRHILNDICRNEDAAGRVGNFPPRVGKAIINELWPNRNNLKVLDPCAGFSGRLISCAASSKVSKYRV